MAAHAIIESVRIAAVARGAAIVSGTQVGFCARVHRWWWQRRNTMVRRANGLDLATARTRALRLQTAAHAIIEGVRIAAVARGTAIVSGAQGCRCTRVRVAARAAATGEWIRAQDMMEVEDPPAEIGYVRSVARRLQTASDESVKANDLVVGRASNARIRATLECEVWLYETAGPHNVIEKDIEPHAKVAFQYAGWGDAARQHGARASWRVVRVDEIP